MAITHLMIGLNRVVCGFIIAPEVPPQHLTCNSILTIRHIFKESHSYQAVFHQLSILSDVSRDNEDMMISSIFLVMQFDCLYTFSIYSSIYLLITFFPYDYYTINVSHTKEDSIDVAHKCAGGWPGGLRADTGVLEDTMFPTEHLNSEYLAFFMFTIF